MIQFTRNYSDRSNDSGFQFEFHCDRCGNGHMSPFVTSKVGFASSLLKAAGSLFGGAASHAAHAGDHLKDALRGRIQKPDPAPHLDSGTRPGKDEQRANGRGPHRTGRTHLVGAAVAAAVSLQSNQDGGHPAWR